MKLFNSILPATDVIWFVGLWKLSADAGPNVENLPDEEGTKAHGGMLWVACPHARVNRRNQVVK